MAKKSRVRNVLVALGSVALFFVLSALTGVGCVSVANLEYRECVHALDDKSELSISTHPSWFPAEEANIPFVYVKLVTDEYVALQLHVRERVQGLAATGALNLSKWAGLPTDWTTEQRAW